MSLRQPPSNLSSWIRVFVAAFIALHITQSAWLVVEFDGAYTEGRPAPTEFHALIAMDKDQTLIDVDIEKATAFLLYTYTRNSSVDGIEETTNPDSPAHRHCRRGLKPPCFRVWPPSDRRRPPQRRWWWRH